jgi:uncharacterized OB-fold protein
MDAVPYTVFVVSLDGAEGCRLIAPGASATIEEVAIGWPVRICWDRKGDVAFPVVELLEES